MIDGRRRWMRWGLMLTVALVAGPAAAQAQVANIFGALGNFDAANFEGQDAHGFEIQLEGVQASDVVALWPGNKFGQPVVVPYATGVYVRYLSQYDPSTRQFTATTVPHTPGTPFAGTCYMGSAAYAQAGCDHFGVHLGYPAQPTSTVYRWLLADPANPGGLVASAYGVSIPAPVWTFVPPPPTQPTAPPELVAEIVATDPPEVEGQYGDATWVRVFKTELDREVALDELTSDNPIVPQDPTQIETSWDLIQVSPPGGHKQRGKHRNQGSVNSGSRSVIRRYETYAYTGAYDPVTHEAACGGDGSCNAPLDGELGDMLGAQMAAVNVGVPALTVARVGSGTVSSSDKVLSCGSKCTSTYAVGTVVTLTASPSGTVFGGWQGACQGTNPQCTVTVNDEITATALFVAQFTLSVGRSNPGTVIGTPNGNDRQLNCGGTCSAKFTSGTTVRLTAIPPTGKAFAGWSGSGAGPCSLSPSPVCDVTITKDTSVQANFTK